MAGLGPESAAPGLPELRPRTILTSDTDDDPDNDIDDDLVDNEEDDEESTPEAGGRRPPSNGRRRRAPSSRSRSLTSLTDGESGPAIAGRLSNHFRILEMNGSQGSLSQVSSRGYCVSWKGGGGRTATFPSRDESRQLETGKEEERGGGRIMLWWSPVRFSWK